MLEGSLHFPLPNSAKDKVTELDKLRISTRLSSRRKKTSTYSMFKDRPDLLYWIQRRRGRGHETHFHSQLDHHCLGLLVIVSLVVIADQNGSPQTFILRNMIYQLDEALTTGGFSHYVG